MTAITRKTANTLMETELGGSGLCTKYIKFLRWSQKQFLDWAEANGMSNLRMVTQRTIYNYQRFLLNLRSKQSGKPLASGALHDRYYAVKMLFSVLYRAGIVADNVTGGIQFETPKNEGLKRQAFSKEVMADILEKMDITTRTGLRDRALFELIYSSGLRVSEAANLLIKDVSFPRREMIVRGKFGRDRLVPISKIARDYLVLYLDTRIHDTDTPVFQGVYRNQGLKPDSISRHFSDLLKNYGIKKQGLSTHSIRHASASHLLENGAGIRHVQELLGHRNIETTTLYTHISSENLAKIYRKYHPQEHDLFDAVDEVYKKRLRLVFLETGKKR